MRRREHPPGTSVLPSFATPAILAAAAWTAVAPYVLDVGTASERAAVAAVPGGVVFAFTAADYALWRARGRPWHDWHVILLLLPAIAAAVWVTAGALLLDAGWSGDGLLACGVGPGIAMLGLLTTTISYHGRHHPDEYCGTAGAGPS